MNKKTLVIIIALTLTAVSLTACGCGNGTDRDNKQPVKQETAADDSFVQNGENADKERTDKDGSKAGASSQTGKTLPSVKDDSKNQSASQSDKDGSKTESTIQVAKNGSLSSPENQDKKSSGSAATVDSSTDPDSSTSGNTNSSVQESKPTTNSPTQANNSSGSSQSSSQNKPASPSNTGSSQNKPASTSTPTHTHSWTPVTKTVHHDATYSNNWVQDSAAWDEQVLVKDAWDEEVTEERYENHTFCSECGADFTALGYSQGQANDHIKQHALNGDANCGYYSSSIAVPYTRTVHHDAEYKTVHHEATGHYEQVLASAAWDETVTTGYKCSCGATK